VLHVDEVVIDTNVLAVANGAHDGASNACRRACVEHLQRARQGCVIVLDDRHRILSEYLRNVNPNRGTRVGDAFLKWLLQNKANHARVHFVPLTELPDGSFIEFPDAELQPKFDPSDRKFPAVANAHSNKPPIWQAVDSKWLAWWQPLAAAGVRVVFLCPDDICTFFKSTFPNRLVPPLPP